MPKSSVTFVCRECGGESLRWAGQCPHCRAWNSLEEAPAPRRGESRLRQAAVPIPITEIPEDSVPRLGLRWDELNRVLGGGIVKGSLVLLSGEPGVGKSTLLMEVASQLASR